MNHWTMTRTTGASVNAPRESDGRDYLASFAVISSRATSRRPRVSHGLQPWQPVALPADIRATPTAQGALAARPAVRPTSSPAHRSAGPCNGHNRSDSCSTHTSPHALGGAPVAPTLPAAARGSRAAVLTGVADDRPARAPPPHPSPFHPTNAYPSAAYAVSCTVVPPPIDAERVGPQSMPLGELVAQLSPVSSPSFWIVSKGDIRLSGHRPARPPSQGPRRPSRVPACRRQPRAHRPGHASDK